MFESPELDLSGLAVVDPGQEDRRAASSSATAEQFLGLLASDPAALPTDLEVLDLVAAWERVVTFASARAHAAMAEFARRPAGTALGQPDSARGPVGSVMRSHADDELAVALGITRLTASGRLATALALPQRLPLTAAAFATGRLDAAKARTVVIETAHLSDAVAGAVESAVMDERACAQPPARLRDRLRRACIKADPAAAQDRCDRARQQRAISRHPQPDGMTELVALLPAADAEVVLAAVDAAARRQRAADGAAGTIDQLRADCFVAPFREALRTGTLAGAGRLQPSQGQEALIRITIPAAALLGLTETPAELDGYGPITAGEARRLASDARWQRLLTDSQGDLIDIGAVYRPDSRTRRLVVARDRRCRFPGCSAPAAHCDLDHVVPYPTGPTSPENLVALCRRHHRLKHGHGGADRARIRLSGPDLCWRLPTGQEAVSSPAGSPSAAVSDDAVVLIEWLARHRPGSPPRGDPPARG